MKTYNQDCISGLRNNIDDNSVDLIFTDPPYGIDGDKLDVHYGRDEKYVVGGYIEVPLKNYAEFSENWITECDRVLRPGGSMYIVSGYTNLHHILNALHKTNLVEINHIIAKYSFAVYTKLKWVSSHYHVLFWRKKGKNVTFNTNAYYTDSKDSYHDRMSVQEMKRENKPKQLKNRNQLPLKFIEKFIRYSSNPKDVVLDPFCGGFTTAEVALKNDRDFIGFELNKEAYDTFVPNLKDIKPVEKPSPKKPNKKELVAREKMRKRWRKAS